MPSYEVELRGLLTLRQYTALDAFLQKNAHFKGEFDRLLIIYTKGLEREYDVRLRITNGETEIIIKKGHFLKAAAKEEIVLNLREGEFQDAIDFFTFLGYPEGMVARRIMRRYRFQGIEFSLVQVVPKIREGFYFEAERMSQKKDAGDSEKQILKMLDQFGLKAWSHDEYARYIKKLDREANKWVDFRKTNARQLSRLFRYPNRF